MKRIATTTALVGLVLLATTLLGGATAQAKKHPPKVDDDVIHLANLAGNFASRGSGFLTACLNADFTALEDCASAPHLVPENITLISHFTRDADGNSCGVSTSVTAPVFGTKNPALVTTATNVITITSFDETTGSGTTSVSQYHGGSCNGAVFDSTGATLTATATSTFVVSDSGNRFELINTGFSAVTSAFSVAGSVQGQVFSNTFIRQ
jgi:hypothetical protein